MLDKYSSWDDSRRQNRHRLEQRRCDDIVLSDGGKEMWANTYISLRLGNGSDLLGQANYGIKRPRITQTLNSHAQMSRAGGAWDFWFRVTACAVRRLNPTGEPHVNCHHA